MALITYSNIDEQYAKNKQLKREDVAKITEWQRLQPHLPNPRHPIEIAIPLNARFYNNEMAKQLIDTIYTIYTQHPEFFANRDPLREELQQTLNTIIVTSFPNVTPEGYTVGYARLLDCDPSMFNFNNAVKICAMAIDLHVKQNGCFPGYVGILDVQGATVVHLLKFPIMGLIKVMDFVRKAFPLRIISLHLVNAVPFIDKILTIARTVLDTELLDILHVHFGDNSTIFKFVPKDILPMECGGSTFNATNYYKKITRINIENHAEYFKQEDKRLVDESKRPTKLLLSGDVLHVEGTFKKIEID